MQRMYVSCRLLLVIYVILFSRVTFQLLQVDKFLCNCMQCISQADHAKSYKQNRCAERIHITYPGLTLIP